MSDKVWVNIGKWLKPIGSTFTVEIENGNPKKDPAALFDGHWVEYQTQTIRCGVKTYSGMYIHFTRDTENDSVTTSVTYENEPSETPEWIAQNTDTTGTEWGYPLYRSWDTKIFKTYKRIA